MTSPSAELVTRGELLMEQAIAAQKGGRTDIAARLYRAVLESLPDHPEANHNLAILLLQSGRVDLALALFQRALENDADRHLYWISFARALLLGGRAADAAWLLAEGKAHMLSGPVTDALAIQAESLLQHSAKNRSPTQQLSDLAERQASAMASRGELEAAAVRLRNSIARRPPNSAQLLLQLGNILVEMGEVADAVIALKDAIAVEPELAEAHYHLGSILSENGAVAEGFAHLKRRAELVYQRSQVRIDSELAHKQKHDAEQRAYLIAKGVIDANTPTVPFVMGDGARVPGMAVNPRNGGAGLKERWDRALPPFLVFDDFLAPHALEQLRDFCARSTIWKRVYEAGYIGATPEDGFACPLLAQIVEEVQEVYGAILGAHPFRYLGAFKYDSELSTGTNTHADFSSLNVNLYITPDEANLAPDRGGMVIWNLAATSESELRFYNGNEHKLCEMLESRRATAHRIPHHANRGVIFASNLFHKTDDYSFKEGYLNKRINVSLLYGYWGAGPA